jgi:hypothetical protein
MDASTTKYQGEEAEGMVDCERGRAQAPIWHLKYSCEELIVYH